MFLIISELLKGYLKPGKLVSSIKNYQSNYQLSIIMDMTYFRIFLKKTKDFRTFLRKKKTTEGQSNG